MINIVDFESLKAENPSQCGQREMAPQEKVRGKLRTDPVCCAGFEDRAADCGWPPEVGNGPQLTASRETGTSGIQAQGTDFANYQISRKTSFEEGRQQANTNFSLVKPKRNF